MKLIFRTLIMVLCAIIIAGGNAAGKERFKPKVVYQSASLVITRLSEQTWEHTSFLQTDDFGKVPCNGLIVCNNKEAVIFDTPTSDSVAEELIGWLQKTLHCKINAIIATHFHNDCLGGLQAFNDHKIASYASIKTIALATENKSAIPGNGFGDSLRLELGDRYVVARFLGEGHTRDNVVGYYPAEDIMFGGCLVKELGAGKGYLGDANVAAWSGTVERVKKEFPKVKIIVPGHGAYGDVKLLDYTIRLFKKP